MDDTFNSFRKVAQREQIYLIFVNVIKKFSSVMCSDAVSVNNLFVKPCCVLGDRFLASRKPEF